MFDVLVVAHGRLGDELLATARMLCGELGGHVSSLGLAIGESADALRTRIEAHVRASTERGGCLVLCDLVGGSPFLMAAQAYRDLVPSVPVEVVGGLNLGMLLEVCAQRAGLTVAQGARVALAAASQSVKSLSESLS